MTTSSFKSALLALTLLGLVVPTGAVVTGAVDDVFESNGIVLQPHDGPNGEYADIGSDGNLSIDITDPGVNNEGRTIVRKVFVIANEGDQTTRVWLTHDATDSVTLYESVSGGLLDQTAIEKNAIQSEGDSVKLKPDQQIVVSVAIDTESTAVTAGDRLLSDISLHAQRVETKSRTPRDTSTPTQRSTPTPTPTPVDEETVEVEFTSAGGSTEGMGVTVTPIDPQTLAQTDPVGDGRPSAIINLEGGAKQVDTQQTQNRDSRAQAGDGINQSLQAQGIDAVTTVGEETVLDGSRSTVDTTGAVDNDQQIVKAVDITPPEGMEDQSATVRMRVSRAKLGGSDPSNARIGHRTENGWQLLNTRVVETTERSVLLETETTGFSPFAVFARPKVKYTWTLPNGETVSGSQIRSRFDEAGYYNVSLTVRDAFGNSDTTQYRILVNDVPDVTIQRPERVTANTSTTLQANVSDRFGNVTVVWQLPNGSEATGKRVNYTFDNGSATVVARAVDEYGANATARQTVRAGPPTASDILLDRVGASVELLTWLVILGGCLFVVGVARQFTALRPPSPAGWLAGLRRRRHDPRIVVFENPSWDVTRERFEIDTLRIIDPDDDLERVEIAIVDRDTVVARKTVEMDPTGTYEASPEHIPGVRTSSLRKGATYAARVRAVDARDRSVTTLRRVNVVSDIGRSLHRGSAAD